MSIAFCHGEGLILGLHMLSKYVTIYYAPNFEKVGDILVSACPCVCVCVCVWGMEILS